MWFADSEMQNPHPEDRRVRYPAMHSQSGLVLSVAFGARGEPCLSANQIPTLCASLYSLVLAARIQHRQDHQVRQRKQPLIGLLPRCLIRVCDKTEVAAAGQTVEMLQADPGQCGNL